MTKGGDKRRTKEKKKGGKGVTKRGQNVVETTKKRKRKFDLGDKRYILCFLCVWNIIQIVAEWLQKMCRKEKSMLERKKGGRPTKIPAMETLDFMRQTMTDPQIAEEFGVSVATVRRWVRKYRKELESNGEKIDG